MDFTFLAFNFLCFPQKMFYVQIAENEHTVNKIKINKVLLRNIV